MRERERKYSVRVVVVVVVAVVVVVVVVAVWIEEMKSKKLDVTIRYGTVTTASGINRRGLATIHGVTVRIQPGRVSDWRRGCSRARG